MNRIFYWRDVYGDAKLFEPYRAKIAQLLAGEYRALNLEILRGYRQPPLYSIRVNIDTRILFTTYENSICLLDVVLNHDYEKSRFLKSKVLQAYLGKREIQDEPVFQFDEDNGDALPKEPIETQDYIAIEPYHHLMITLNTEQEEAIHVQLPAIIYGPAGAGKTCVALSILLQYIRDHAGEDGAFPVIYVCQNPNLIREKKLEWDEMMENTPYRDLVHFKTYDEIFCEHAGEVSLANEETFHIWYKDRLKQRKPGPKFKSEDEADLTWHEFRICSGYDKEQYIALGKRHSSIDKTKRQEIYQLYLDYLAHLVSLRLVSTVLHPLEQNRKYPCIVIDEAQDLSYRQLSSLYQAANGVLVYCLGDHQVLGDGKSRFPYLCNMITEQHGRKPSIVELSKTY